jgi:hypothetical protein
MKANAAVRLAAFVGSTLAVPGLAAAQSKPLPPLPPPANEAPALPSPPSVAPPVDAAPPAPLPAGDAPAVIVETPTSPAPPPPLAPPLAAAPEGAASLAQPDPWVARPLAIEGHLGFGPPIGDAALAVDYSPLPVLSVNLGIGLSPSGVQYGLMPRVRFVRFGHRVRFAFYVGAGVSAGHYDQPSGGSLALDGSKNGGPARYDWDQAYWLNGEVGMEMRLADGLVIRPYVGLADLLNTKPTRTIPGEGFDVPGGRVSPVQAYIGGALGFAPKLW